MSLAAFIGLLESYRDTRYLFHADGIEYDVRIDERTPIAETFLRRRRVRSAAFITAMNPRSHIRTVSENAAATAKLEAEVRQRGHAFLLHVGKALQSEWPHERRLLVLDMAEREAAGLIVVFGPDRPDAQRAG